MIRHICALSGGKDSTAMVLRLSEVEPREYQYICTPTGNELPEMFQHWRRLGEMLGEPIKPITAGKSLQGLIRAQNALPNYRMRWCTRLLKIEPFQAYLIKMSPAVSYVGIRADEADDRAGVDWEKLGGITNRYPLVEWGWDEADVREYLRYRNVEIPARTDCAMCFFQRLGEWWKLWIDYPEAYAEAEKYEDLTGHTLRSDARDSWPASLKDMRGRFEDGDIPRGANQTSFNLGVSGRSAMCSVCAR